MTTRTPRVASVTIEDGKIVKKPARLRAGLSRSKLEAKAKKEAAAWAGKSKGKP